MPKNRSVPADALLIHVVRRNVAEAMVWLTRTFGFISILRMSALVTPAAALFPPDNPWNQNIANAPVATNSATVISNIVALSGNGRFHPDFGQDTQSANPLYGIPYNAVHGNTAPKVNVVIDAYPGESDLLPAPIPANAVVEGDFQNGPDVGVNNRGDSHLLVWDVDNTIAYEFYRASRPSENADGSWHADAEAVWDMKANSFRTLGWTSADAAGLPILPGLARPDEALPVSQGGQGAIRHALRFTLQNAVVLNKYLYPASHNANPGNSVPAIQPPMGARFRLKASVDISLLNPQSQAVAQALKNYGMIVADNGSSFFLSGASYSVDSSNRFSVTWDDNDIQDTTHGLKSLHFTDFEVVDLTPAVTSVSPAHGGAGTPVTIIGRNFSGAAGRLQMWFGTSSVPASVTDDAHLTASAPSGSGTVDVQVQSGIGNADFPENVTRPVWGYGLSPTSAAARFTIDSQAVIDFHAWLAAHGLPSDGSADYLDSDGDGMNNWQEYVAGTDPTNANSVFRIISGRPLPAAGFLLRWSSESNRFYDLSRASNLTAGTNAFITLQGGTNLPATPPQNTYTDSVSSGNGLHFYRIDVHR
ncbi:MAG TPA: IPT/TIG domain-containing protein [Candidatus Acidoferrum sp.]|nr:IPT/TIG domain-containing protein [Candidatus Acidoferrum sp.]